MSNFKIRNATFKDASDILSIYAPYITDTYITFETEVPTIKEFTARIESIIKNYPYLVCEVDGKIIGYTYASEHRQRGAYQYSADVSIYILPEYQQQGNGKLLYTKLFELLRERGIYTIFAGIALPNQKSLGLHKSFGFKEVGVFHNIGYKFDKWIDTMWLEKPLIIYD